MYMSIKETFSRGQHTLEYRNHIRYHTSWGDFKARLPHSRKSLNPSGCDEAASKLGKVRANAISSRFVPLPEHTHTHTLTISTPMCLPGGLGHVPTQDYVCSSNDVLRLSKFF